MRPPNYSLFYLAFILVAISSISTDYTAITKLQHYLLQSRLQQHG